MYNDKNGIILNMLNFEINLNVSSGVINYNMRGCAEHAYSLHTDTEQLGSTGIILNQSHENPGT